MLVEVICNINKLTKDRKEGKNCRMTNFFLLEIE